MEMEREMEGVLSANGQGKESVEVSGGKSEWREGFSARVIDLKSAQLRHPREAEESGGEWESGNWGPAICYSSRSAGERPDVA